MMYRNLRAQAIKQTRSQLLDQKNKLTLPPPDLKGHPAKSITTRGYSRRHRSPPASQNEATTVLHPSPKAVASQPLETTAIGFSKSEEQTKAEKDEHTQGSPQKEKGWTGLVSEYKQEIMSYVLKREDEFRIDGSYLNHSQVLSTKMRVYLVRHIFKICNKFDLLRTTLHTAVHYLDMFLAKSTIINDQLQAIIASQACLFMAMKYEQIYPPDLRDWVDRKHRKEVLQMEGKILAALNFQLAHYTVQHQLKMQMWEQGQDMDQDQSQIALLADLSLFDLKLREQPASEIAAAIYALSRHIDPPNKKMALNVRWMVQRNPEPLAFLQQQKYGHHNSAILF